MLRLVLLGLVLLGLTLLGLTLLGLVLLGLVLLGLVLLGLVLLRLTLLGLTLLRLTLLGLTLLGLNLLGLTLLGLTLLGLTLLGLTLLGLFLRPLLQEIDDRERQLLRTLRRRNAVDLAGNGPDLINQVFAKQSVNMNSILVSEDLQLIESVPASKKPVDQPVHQNRCRWLVHNICIRAFVQTHLDHDLHRLSDVPGTARVNHSLLTLAPDIFEKIRERRDNRAVRTQLH